MTLEEEELELEEDDDRLLLLRFLEIKRELPFFSEVWTVVLPGISKQVPMALAAAEPALVVGLRALGFLGLSGHFHLDALLIELLAIHAINSLMDGLF